MNASASRLETILSARAMLIGIALVTAVLWLTTNLPWRLDDYDQAQQAFTSYEMIHEGHWFYQRTPHELIAQKPPLVGWVSAGLFELTRCWDWAWRLPSLAAATVLAIAIYSVAKSAYGVVPAVLALSAFSLNLLTVRLATLVRTDMPLALTIYLAGALIFHKVRTGEAWQTRDRLLFCAFLSASMWIKGPFVCIFLLPPLILARWGWRNRLGVAVWPGWWPWLVSLLIFSPWVIEGLRLFPTFYEQVIAFEVIHRLDPAVHRPQSVFFYVGHLLHKFAPWSALTIGLGIAEFRCRKESGVRRMDPATLWLVLWSITGLLIMSLVPSKRVDRVYSVVPPLCLLLASQVAAGLSPSDVRHQRTRWLVASMILAVLFTSGYTIWKVSFGYYNHLDALRRFGDAVRLEAKQHGWRYEVISGLSGSEGMLLYLELPRFTEPDDAVRRWNAGQLEALVLPTNVAPELLSQLAPAGTPILQSSHRASEPRVDYEFVVRDPHKLH